MLDAFATELGSVASPEFIGVDPQGWDKHLVRHERGTEDERTPGSTVIFTYENNDRTQLQTHK